MKSCQKSISENSRIDKDDNGSRVRRYNDSKRGLVSTNATNVVRIPNSTAPTTTATVTTNHPATTTIVAPAAAKNIIIPNAITPVRIEWFTSKTTTNTAASTATLSKKNDTSRITSVSQNATNKNVSVSVSSTTPFRAATPASGSILIHQSNQEETWPGGAIWDISWCMAQLIIGMIYDASSVATTAKSSSGGSTSSGTTNTITTTTTTATFYNDISIMTNPSPSLVKPQGLSQCVQNNIQIPARLIGMLQNVKQEPSVMALATLLGNHHSKQQYKNTNVKPTKNSHHRSSNRNSNKTNNESIIVLELGCGTGLTGIVMAAAAATVSTTSSSCTVILTDLDVVIQNVTLPNVQRNIKSIKHNVFKTTFPLFHDFPSKNAHNSIDQQGTSTIDAEPMQQQLPLNIYTIKNNSSSGSSGCLIATPLCWGNHDDMKVVQSMIRYLQKPQHNQNSNHATHESVIVNDTENNDGRYLCSNSNDGIPDILIIGDVAYQHKPGATSHFDVLLETILHFTKCDQTMIIFGLRIRMNASMDLYQMLLQYFVDIIEPIVPNEIDPIRFPMANHSNNKKSMNTMTIHFMKRKQNNVDTPNE